MSPRPATFYDTKPLFLVYAPDKPDSLAQRLSVRERHLTNARKLTTEGILRFGGAMIDEASITTEKKNMSGSTFFYRADSLADARNIVEADPYFTDGVWDLEKLAITPFHPAGPM